MPKLIIIQPDGTRTEQEWPDDGTRPELHTLQQAVGGGLIQPVSAFIPEDVRMEAYANEEGVLKGFRENPEGSKAVNWPVGEIDTWRGIPIDNLVGPVVLLEGFPTHEEIDAKLDADFESGDAELCLMCRSVAYKTINDAGDTLFRCTSCDAEYGA